jgi:hypothetical protein
MMWQPILPLQGSGSASNSTTCIYNAFLKLLFFSRAATGKRVLPTFTKKITKGTCNDILPIKLLDASDYVSGTFRLSWNNIELAAGGTADLPFNVPEDTLRQAVESLVDANG